MSITSRIISKVFKLPPAENYKIIIERDIKIPMPDGVVLLANHYYPRGSSKLPTILVRCPYGRASMFAFLYGRLLAERGFQVLLQSCRGTFGSGGQFDPLHNERTDGLATIDWMKKQEWFSGEYATMGPSYLGYVQWAIAHDAGPELKAVAAQVTASDLYKMFYAGESFTLLDGITWVNLVCIQEKSSLASFSTMFTERKLRPAFKQLPLSDVDRLVVGRRVQFWQDWLEHSEPGDEWWQPMDHSGMVTEVTAPVNLIGGWYDIFLPWMMKDYAALRDAGREPYLTIGPWYH